MGTKPDPLRKRFGPLLDKTLKNALAHRIGREFPRLGGPRILDLCAQMVLEVLADHLRPREHVAHGQVLWLGISVDDPPARGKRTADTDLVPRRATVHDVGSGLTHKRIICRKRYLEGKSSDEIARETYHSLEAVDRYLGTYDRVRHCHLEGLAPGAIAYTLNCSLSLVQEYLAINQELEARHA